MENISHDGNDIHIKGSNVSLSYSVGEVDSISLGNKICKIAEIDKDYLNGWDEGYLFNDSLFFVIKSVTDGHAVEVYGSDSTYYADSLTIDKYACINKVGNDMGTSIGIGYDSSDNVSFIRIRERLYTFNYYSTGDSIDVFCYDRDNNKFIVSTYSTSSPSYIRNNSIYEPMKISKGISFSDIGSAISNINLIGDVSSGNWGGVIGDLAADGLAAGAAKALGIDIQLFIELINWLKAPYEQMRDYVFGKSNIVITSIDEKSSVIRGKIQNVETIPDVDWEFGNESVPEKYRQYGQKNIVYYHVDVVKDQTLNTYSLGPEVANHKADWSFSIPKMSHGYYLFKPYLTGSGFEKAGNFKGYYCLGDPPTYTHSKEKAEFDSSSGQYKVSFHIDYTPLQYDELYYHQGLRLETSNGTHITNIDYKTPSVDVAKNLSKSEFKDLGDGQFELEVKVKYWYLAQPYSNKTQYVDLEPFTIKTNSLCPDSNHPHMIDLGLPSGTKWACCNVGADKPEAYGGYYAWGETEEKNYYSRATYQYCTDSNGDGYVDFNEMTNLGSDIAGTGYDVAHVKWGGSWVMPSLDQIKELLNKCSTQWTTKNGVNGRTFTGPSGGTIFLPAAGCRWEGLEGAGYNGYYWSSTRVPSDDSYDACTLSFNSGGAYWSDYYDGGHYRWYGYTVRPVSR